MKIVDLWSETVSRVLKWIIFLKTKPFGSNKFRWMVSIVYKKISFSTKLSSFLQSPKKYFAYKMTASLVVLCTPYLRVGSYLVIIFVGQILFQINFSNIIYYHPLFWMSLCFLSLQWVWLFMCWLWPFFAIQLEWK